MSDFTALVRFDYGVEKIDLDAPSLLAALDMLRGILAANYQRSGELIAVEVNDYWIH